MVERIGPVLRVPMYSDRKCSGLYKICAVKFEHGGRGIQHLIQLVISVSASNCMFGINECNEIRGEFSKVKKTIFQENVKKKSNLSYYTETTVIGWQIHCRKICVNYKVKSQEMEDTDDIDETDPPASSTSKSSGTLDSDKSRSRKSQRKSSIVQESYPTPNRTFQNDAINTEMIYYIGVIRDILPSMSVHTDRRKLVPWIRKLFSPEFHIDRLRKKRNKYLLHLVLVSFNDKVFGIFKDPPKIGGIPDILELRSAELYHEARWEKDTYWQEILYGLHDSDSIKCTFHDYCNENEDRGKSLPIAGELLDEEFKFFLYLARPYLALMPDPNHKKFMALWILTLCKVTRCSCLTMKAVRNDYMQALLGYLQDLRLPGPFSFKPPDNGQSLKPLRQFLRSIKTYNPKKTILDPTSEDAERFLSEQPIPNSGAFCYIAVTGDAKEPEKVSTVPLSTTKYETYFGI